MPPDIGAVFVPQQMAGAVTWQNYLGFLEHQLDKMLQREEDGLDELLELYRLSPMQELPRVTWPEMLLREDPVLNPVSRAHAYRPWPQAATYDQKAEAVLQSSRSLRKWLEDVEMLAEGRSRADTALAARTEAIRRAHDARANGCEPEALSSGSVPYPPPPSTSTSFAAGDFIKKGLDDLEGFGGTGGPPAPC